MDMVENKAMIKYIKTIDFSNTDKYRHVYISHIHNCQSCSKKIGPYNQMKKGCNNPNTRIAGPLKSQKQKRNNWKYICVVS